MSHEYLISLARALSESLGRVHAPLKFGLRITTLVRDTSAEAWHEAEARVGQQRLLALHERGVLDSCLYTAPGKFGADDTAQRLEQGQGWMGPPIQPLLGYTHLSQQGCPVTWSSRR